MGEFDFQPPARNGDNRDQAIHRFYIRPERNAFKSTQEGREVFEDVEFVEIIIPGDKHCIVDRRVKQEDRDRWGQSHAAFKNNMEAPTEGTPIGEWAGIGAAQAMELKACHVRTVEQLANLSDTVLAKAVPLGGHALRERAKSFLAQAEGNAPTERLLAENATLRAQTEELQRQLADLANRFTAFQQTAPAPQEPVHAES